LLEWQRTHRLVGSSEPRWIVENLFLDSLLFLRVLPPGITTLLDLGSGAGIPGIPIKLVRPAIQLVLVESRRRRASFLSTAVRDLGLSGTRVVGGRAEDHLAELAGAAHERVELFLYPGESHLFADSSLAAYDADATAQKEHFAFFEGLLTATNGALAQSDLFRTIGSGRTDDNASAEPFTDAVEKIRKERFGGKPYEEGFALAFDAASTEHRDLAAKYARRYHSSK